MDDIKSTFSKSFIFGDKGKRRFMDPEKILNEVGLKIGKTVADLGCGTGFFVIPAAKILGPEGKIYAIDIQKLDLAEVEANARIFGFKNIEYLQGDLEKEGSTKIPDASLDFVIVSNVLSQTENDETVLLEAAKFLKPEGKFLLIDWEDTNTPFGPPREKRLSKDDALSLASSLGFSLEKETDAGMYHYGLVFSKN
ncbi:hypothetical protein COY23_00850 [bacterium (Candidatus Torokbacteria) CG_4_10_14_0_2_um_filter_35_8]|nr:MAG: hypothetical protein COY23_00850 [bacterium (Candidatus Torokbacteria) CG_4_10_14_0_2_um_filter_35_8]